MFHSMSQKLALSPRKMLREQWMNKFCSYYCSFKELQRNIQAIWVGSVGGRNGRNIHVYLIPTLQLFELLFRDVVMLICVGTCWNLNAKRCFWPPHRQVHGGDGHWSGGAETIRQWDAEYYYVSTCFSPLAIYWECSYCRRMFADFALRNSAEIKHKRFVCSTTLYLPLTYYYYLMRLVVVA